MKHITVLGSGCAKCTKTAEIIAKIAEEMNIEVTVDKDTSPQSLLEHGVMRTPAVLVDNQLVHSGSIPHHDEISEWLQQS